MTSSKNIYWLGGSWHDRKEFVLNEICHKKQEQGFQILEWNKDLDLGDAGSQIDFFAPPRLVFVAPKTRIGKKQLDTIVEQASDTLMLVICETPAIPSTTSISASNAVIVVYPEPKPWEIDGKYGEIFRDILKKRYSKDIDLALATDIVKRIGQDFSLMEKEALKYSTLDESKLTVQNIIPLIAINPSFETKKLVEALRALDPQAFLRACLRIETYATVDQTMAICRGLLGYSVYQWIEIDAMLKSRYSISDICEALDIKFKNSLEKEVIPFLNKIGTEGLDQLVDLLNQSERNVLEHGVGEPFQALKYGLLSIILASKDRDPI